MIGANRRLVALAVGSFLVVGLALSTLGLSAGASLKLAALVCLQGIAGAVLWASVLQSRRPQFLELLGMGISLGTLFSLLGAQASLTMGWGLWGWLILPGIVAALFFARVVGKPRNYVVDKENLWGWLGFLSSSFMGILATIPGIRNTPIVTGYVSGDSYHGDLVFLEALSKSLATVGPQDSLLLAGHPVRYHWFTYAWSGFMTEVAGVDSFVVLTRLLPMVLVIAASALAVTWVQKISTIPWVAFLSPWLVVVAAYVGADQGTVLVFESPSTGYAAVLGLAFVTAVTSYVRGTLKPSGLAIVALLAAGMVGAKVSEAFVVAAGLLAMSLVAIRYGRADRRRVWLCTLVSGIAMILGYILILAGVSTSDTNVALDGGQVHVSTFQGLNPGPGLAGILLGTFALWLAILPRWAGTVWLLRDRVLRWAPETALGVGTAVAGLGTLVLLRSGTNAAWFALAASSILAVLSAQGLGHALNAVGWNPRLAIARGWLKDSVVWSVIAAGIATLLGVIALAFAEVSGAPVRWRAPVIVWLALLVLAAVIASRSSLQGSRMLKWGVILSVGLICSSIFARFAEPLTWGVSREQLTPIIQNTIRLMDPSAEFRSETRTEAHPASDANSGLGEEPAVGSLSPVPDPGQARTLSVIEWSPALNEAADWLKSVVAPGELVFMDGPLRQPFLPVVTGLPMYLAGLPYSSGYTTQDGLTAIDMRSAATAQVMSSIDQATALDLWDSGVRWLWIQGKPATGWSPIEQLADTVYVNREVRILRLNDPGANFP